MNEISRHLSATKLEDSKVTDPSKSSHINISTESGRQEIRCNVLCSGNDSFKPLFSGFSSLQMTIYDYRGNMLYFEEATADPANLTQPLIINGWDGETITDSPYYIYTINGITLFGDIEVEKSGTFIIIR